MTSEWVTCLEEQTRRKEHHAAGQEDLPTLPPMSAGDVQHTSLPSISLNLDACQSAKMVPLHP